MSKYKIKDIQELLISATAVCDNATYDEAEKHYIVSTDVIDRLTDIEVKLQGL